VNTAVGHAVLSLDEAHGHLANACTTAGALPSDRWYRLLDYFASKIVVPESAPAIHLRRVGEQAGQFACGLLVAAAAFLAAEANDLEDRVELLADDPQHEGIRALLSDIVDKVGDDADALIGRVEKGTWQEFFDADRAEFAWRWTNVITSTSHVSMARNELVGHLLERTHQLVEATLAAEFDPSVGRQIGVDMVVAHFTGTETLDETLTLIVERLPDLLDQAPQGVDIASRVVRLTANIAVGYASALREHSFDMAEIPKATATISYARANVMDNAADLLRGIGDGDRAAWEDILHRYGKLVSATVRSFRMQEADALDAIQMTWLRLAENAHHVQFPERLGGWLATTARRECLHILRQAKPNPKLTDAALATIVDPSEAIERPAIDADVTQTLRKLIDELSPRRRTLIRMLFADNPRSNAEIARAAGIPLGGIGPTRARALRQLRDRLDEHELGLRLGVDVPPK
jgi:RNA polymerase sigma factor (sigma-70 family)